MSTCNRCGESPVHSIDSCLRAAVSRIAALEQAQGRSARAWHEKMGLPEPDAEEAQRNVDRETGRPTPSTPEPRVDLRWNSDGTLDEALVYVGGAVVAHLEQMDRDQWWLSFHGVSINLSSRKPILAHVEDEREPPEDPGIATIKRVVAGAEAIKRKYDGPAPEPTDEDREAARVVAMEFVERGYYRDRCADDIAAALARARAEGAAARDAELRALAASWKRVEHRDCAAALLRTLEPERSADAAR